jgi:NADPH-dependent curcumin reductase CurA
LRGAYITESAQKAEMGNPVKRKQNIMAQSTYTSVVLAQRPKALIVPGETFSLKENPMISESDLKDGQVLVETLYLSLDPAMRGWLNGITFSTTPLT